MTKQRSLMIGAALATTLVLAACGGHPPATTGDVSDPPADRGRAETAPPEITLEQATLQAVAVDVVGEHRLRRTLTAGGKVQFDEDKVARVLAPLAGQVVDLRAKIGDAVGKGQVLCAINSREAAAAVGEHIESHRDLELAEKTASMTQDLFDHMAASKIALQQAENELAKARARVARNEQALRVLGLPSDGDLDRFDGRVPLVSPIAGSIIERHVTDGQFIQPDSMPMFMVANLSTVWIIGDVFERDLRSVRVGDSAVISTAAYPGERFDGHVNYISDVIDPSTRTAKVRVSVPNAGSRLKPEMFASIELGVEDADAVLAVPSRAAFTDNGRTWVYVQTGPGRFSRRAVDLDQDEGSMRRIRAGLHAGDRIVVDGALLLRQEEEKRAG